MTLRYLAIIVLTFAALRVIGFKFLKTSKQATRWTVPPTERRSEQE
jgi:hypothetical protein